MPFSTHGLSSAASGLLSSGSITSLIPRRFAASIFDVAVQRHLAGHRIFGVYRTSRERRAERERERDSRRRTVLRHSARGDVYLYVLLVPFEVRQAVALCVGAQVGERRDRRLLHDVAEVARVGYLARAVHDGRLYQYHVAACLGPCETDGRADRAALRYLRRVELRSAEKQVELLLRYLSFNLLALAGERGRHLARSLCELTVEAAHSGLHRVRRNYLLYRRVRDGELFGRKAVLLQDTRDEMLLRDFQLLLHHVARE